MLWVIFDIDPSIYSFALLFSVCSRRLVHFASPPLMGCGVQICENAFSTSISVVSLRSSVERVRDIFTLVSDLFAHYSFVIDSLL